MPIRLLHLTDPHITGEPDTRLAGVDTFATLERVLAAVRSDAWRPDLVVATGDMSQDASPASYQRLREALLGLGLPVWCVPGNHDDLPAMREHLAGGDIRVMEPALLDGWQVVPLDSHVPGASYGSVGSEALAALDASLGAEPERHTLLALHHAPVPVCPERDCRLDDAEELMRVVARHGNVRAVLTGHTHSAADDLRGGVRLLVAPATSLQLVHPREMPDAGVAFWESHGADERVGYRRVELFADGRVESEVIWA